MTSRDLEAYEDAFGTMEFEREQERLRRKALLRLIAPLEAPRVLEVGCGYSSIFEDLVRARRRVIVEPIQRHLDFALSNVDENVVGISSTLEQQSSRLAASFDLVILSSVLHESSDQVEFLRAARECLDSSGTLAMVTTNPRSIHRILGVELGLLSSLDGHTEVERSMQQHPALDMLELEQLLKQCGFSVESATTEIPKILSHRQMNEAMRLGVIDRVFVDQLFALSQWIPEFGSEIFTLARPV